MYQDLNAHITAADVRGIKPLIEIPPKEYKQLEREFANALSSMTSIAGSLANLMQDIAHLGNSDGGKLFNGLITYARQLIAAANPQNLLHPTGLIKAAFQIVMTAAQNGAGMSKDPFLGAVVRNMGKADWQIDPVWMTVADKDELKLRRIYSDNWGWTIDKSGGFRLCTGGSEPQRARVRRIAPPGCDE